MLSESYSYVFYMMYFFFRYAPNGNFTIGGQSHEKYGEFNPKELIRKEMRITSVWWKDPKSVNIYVKEFQLFTVKSKNESHQKRKLLCESDFYFYQDSDEDFLEKCRVTIKDAGGCICLHKVYSQVDRQNRKFYTQQ